jgi:hypothetical protein
MRGISLLSDDIKFQTNCAVEIITLLVGWLVGWLVGYLLATSVI